MTLPTTIGEIPDFVEYIGKYYDAVPLEPNSKICRQTDWSNRDFSVEFLLSWQGEIGLRLIKEEGKPYLDNFDVDGTLTDKDIKNLCENDKKATRKLIADALIPALQEYAIIVKTAKDGYHFFVLVDGEINRKKHDISKKFIYPAHCGIDSVEEQALDGAIEEYYGHHNRYLVGAGSRVEDKFYKVSEKSKINKFGDLKVISADKLEKIVEQALLEAGFEYKKTEEEKMASQYDIGFKFSQSANDLSPFIIDKFSDFIIPILDANHGGKHDAVLALATYLARYLSEDSIIALGEEIIRKTPATFFNDDQHFLETLCSGINSDKEIVTGANYFYEQYAKKVYPNPIEFWFKIIYFTNSNTHFYPTGKKGNSYKRIEFDNKENQINIEYLSINRKGNEYIKNREAILGFQILDIKRIQNPVIRNAPDLYELYYTPAGMTKVYCVTGETMKEIEEAIKQQVGIILNGQWKQVFNQIIAFFSKIDFMNTSSLCSMPGIFRIDGQIRRFNFNNEEVPIGFNLKELKNAVKLLCEIKDAIPTKDEKFGHICRIGLIFPFYHILKEQGHLMKYLFLGGAGGAWKSSIAEMLINFYNPTVKVGKKANIYSAGAFSSPYQVGVKFGISSYGFVVNEPATALHSEELGEILKSSIETDISRSTHDRDYPSISSAIFASNVDIPQDDANLRRYNIFYFQNSERVGEAHLKKIANLLNDKKINDRFQELAPIGDFCFTYLAQNASVLDEESVEELELLMVDKLEEVTDIDLSWMKEYGKDESYQEMLLDVDSEVLSAFVQYVADCYNKVFITYQKINLDKNTATTLPVFFDKDGIITLATRNLCPLISYNPNKDLIVIKGNDIKNWYKKNYGQLITANRFFEEFKDFKDNYDVRLTNFRVQGKQFRGVVFEPKLLVDLLNNDIEGDYDEEDDSE